MVRPKFQCGEDLEASGTPNKCIVGSLLQRLDPVDLREGFEAVRYLHMEYQARTQAWVPAQPVNEWTNNTIVQREPFHDLEAG